jgi:ribonuclease BN (tRNA processing enzyme)
VFPHLHREPLPDVVSVDWSPGTRLAVGEVLLEGFETGHRKDMPTVAVLLTVPVGGRTRRIAYATDMGEVPAASRDLLRGVDLLLGDGSTIGTGDAWHPGTDAVARLASEVGARRLAFTHVGHVRLADADLRARLAPAALARDGDDLLALLPA